MNYLDILDCTISDGEGVRVSLYLSGCSHKCKGCHNPESWDCHAGKPFTDETKEKLIKLLDRSYIDGLTLTGGDPLYNDNIEDVTKLVYEIKQRLPNKTIWLYTGYTLEQVQALKLFRYIDVVVDGPFILEQRDVTLPFRGSSNQRIIRLKGNK